LTTKQKNKQRPYKTAIVLTDTHIRKHDPVTLAAVEAYMGDVWLDYWLHLGDLMDFDCISDFNRNKLRKVEGARVAADYAEANAFLDRHTEACRRKNPACKMVLLEGNHDERVARYIDANPVLENLMEPELQLDLDRRGIQYVRSWSRNELYQLGNARFHHGVYHNKYHAAKMAASFGEPIFYGHLHDIQAYSEILHGNDKTIMAQSLGCLCKYDQEYLRGRPTKWQQAFAVFHIYPDGYFQHFVVSIFKHRFIGPTNGKVYDGREL